MTQITKTYSNAVERVIGVVAVEATDDADTVIIDTTEDGQMVVCRHDDLYVWQQLVTLGLIAV